MKYVVGLLMAVAMLSACKKKNSEECPYSAENTSASAQEEAVVTNYIAANNITGTTELGTSGMYYVIDAQGNTNKPALCNTVVVKYKGQLANGTIFDQTTGTSTASFTLGSLIEGWNRGMQLVGEGGKIRLYIPSSLGYGAAGSFNPNTGLYTIPQNAMLIFDVEIVTVYK
ncbi:FKBP-type peptidyl-prolyl cis-trans isomerase [Lacibacter sediminis]|uniref:Peptidyl-prolyl cis-trans isomerase n=1 Tax=Lacibacter sediminis TaxID=2760713 RepID=A0A7G5XDH7_9BACT|nr:FKBP-type peptidyl-prolyl cis-trans isomerase [Lacibacter sediminis]QNA43530.1 FKBP-type peptidyl-prolyl cis-trans isomerase [Lacibacter sediminis]